MLIKILFWMIACVDAAALLLVFVLGLAAAPSSHTSPLAVAAYLLVVPGLLLAGAIVLFLRAKSGVGRASAFLLVAAVIALFVTGNNSNSQKKLDGRITLQKKDKIPFNTQAEAMDYVISSTFTNVLNSIVHKDKEYKYLHKNKSPEKTYQMAVKSVLKNIDKTHEFVTLLNFSRIIRQKNLGKNVKVRYIKMIFAEEKIKKFINRDDKAAVVRNLLLETNFIDFKDE